MYRRNFAGDDDFVSMKYWDKYDDQFIESL